MSWIAGYRIKIRELATMRYLEDKDREIFSITPTVHYRLQGKSDQLDLGVYVFYKMIMTGVWYRGLPIKNIDDRIINNESVIFLGGVKFDQLGLAYSYDLVISEIGGTTGGAHELNLIFQFPKEAKKRGRNFKRLPCPNFYDR